MIVSSQNTEAAANVFCVQSSMPGLLRDLHDVMNSIIEIPEVGVQLPALVCMAALHLYVWLHCTCMCGCTALVCMGALVCLGALVCMGALHLYV